MAFPSHRLLAEIASVSALLGALGCSGTVVSASDASTNSTQALLAVERTAAAGDAASSVRAHASAYFLRLQAAADRGLAARLVGAAGVLPAMDECEPVGVLNDQGIPLASLGPIDLVDVGEVALEAAKTRATLAARAFPDVVDLVSGVVYTTRDLMADPLPDQGTYIFRTSGSQALPPMTLEGHAPGAIANLYVAGQFLGGQTLTVPRADLTVVWDPKEGADLVYIELASMEDGPLERVRCTFPHAGRGVVPASALPKASAQSISIHLVRHEAVAAPGIHGGEIRFDLATSGTLRLERSTP